MTLVHKVLTTIITMEVMFILAAYIALALLGLGTVFAIALGALVAVVLPVAIYSDVSALLSFGQSA